MFVQKARLVNRNDLLKERPDREFLTSIRAAWEKPILLMEGGPDQLDRIGRDRGFSPPSSGYWLQEERPAFNRLSDNRFCLSLIVL